VAAALATNSITPMNPIPIDLINITNQKRECGKEHQIQLANFDKASVDGYSAANSPKPPKACICTQITTGI
jgi:hypothetical protein